MKKKLIITESQLCWLKANLTENKVFTHMVKKIKEDLDTNYEPITKFVREGGEYFETPMVMVKVDGEAITPKALYEYLKYKYKMGDDFTKQVIRDWMFGNITDDYRLSKNVTMD